MDISRREFTKIGCKIIIGATAGTTIVESLITNSIAAENSPVKGGYNWEEHFWGYVVDTRKCIGCGRCANACKLENHVPFDEEVYRTWIERYRVKKTSLETREEEVVIDSPVWRIHVLYTSSSMVHDFPIYMRWRTFHSRYICVCPRHSPRSAPPNYTHLLQV
ncbi:MAG: 4Fe-4S binding domain protein, partial [Candidatus Methanoperedens nitroreducens]